MDDAMDMEFKASLWVYTWKTATGSAARSIEQAYSLYIILQRNRGSTGIIALSIMYEGTQSLTDETP